MTRGQLSAVIVDDPIESWHEAGFAGNDVIVIGSTTIVPTAGPDRSERGRGILGGSIDGIETLDGLELGSWEPSGAIDAEAHPNGVVAIDHVVVTTPDCDRTTTSFEAGGFDVRRVRKIENERGDRRQTFFWFGDVICELVGPDEPSGAGPARWWGLALTVEDLEATAELLGDSLKPIKPAVQPGRFVATLAGGVGPSVPILFISPHPNEA